ncbi:hypothetical protein COCNU_14G008410 [Cocos nucifera]|uniref:CSD domain-containing protein n=1 Tax=Cocos nucifera TaxID=13894 RepID=A0A8K0IW30_COCNU|nr:hypothetical protein COCNU_14G008410 [Cocos nucifera]
MKEGELGFSFIPSDDSGEDLFIHQSLIKVEGYQCLAEGKAVEFTIVEGDDGRTRPLMSLALMNLVSRVVAEAMDLEVEVAMVMEGGCSCRAKVIPNWLPFVGLLEAVPKELDDENDDGHPLHEQHQ